MTFFCAKQATKVEKGKEVFFIVEKQLRSVFAGNWPRLETSINQSYVSTSNKDTTVVTVQQIHSVYILLHKDGINQH